jgi:formylglycine-generating enzyme required for sulfatase activity
MVVVPAGRFLMGAPKSEKGHEPAEEPQHEVTVPAPFAIDARLDAVDRRARLDWIAFCKV